jgi:hypothetical protein
MKPIFVDDRTPEQRETHNCIIRAIDRFMSGWGKAKGGNSYAAWACKPEHAQAVFDWVSNRSEMKHVTACGPGTKPHFGNGAHVHIYVVNDHHPALDSMVKAKS